MEKPSNEGLLIFAGLVGFGVLILVLYGGFIDKRLFDFRELVALGAFANAVIVAASFMRYGAALARFSRLIEGEGDDHR